MATNASIVEDTVIDRAVTGSWPLITQKVVTANAPTPELRKSYLLKNLDEASLSPSKGGAETLSADVDFSSFPSP